jgi:acyl-CoA synthetase (AMP-forming)/AMP-acid ligase II
MNESSTHQHLKPNYGRRLIVNLVDEVAAVDPSRPFVFVPRSSEPKDGWKPVTYREISNAVNHVAHDVTDKVKKKLQQELFPTLAYIGPNDVRYLIFMLGCVKAGFKALFISPRNSVQGQLSLFEATNCNFLFYDKSYQSSVQLWLREREMKLIMVSSANSWLQSTVTPFPYSPTFDDARWDPLVVLHTSGSTGIPKPIVLRQGYFAVADAFHDMPDYQGAQFILKEWMDRGKKIFLSLPMFHIAGCGFLVLITVFYGAQIHLGIPDQPISAELTAECLITADVDAAMLPPSIVEELSLSDQSVEQLSKLSYVAFAGGKCFWRR